MQYKIINSFILFGLLTRSSLAINLNDDVSLHGYGTVGVAYQDNEDILYRNSLNAKNGAKGNFSLANYSSFGLQVDAQISEKLSLTAQGIVSEYNNNGNHLELGWLNAKYQFTDTSSVRIGKMRLPAFMYSDILNVSYSYDWIRLPDMYSLIAVNNYTGIEFNYDRDINDFTIMSTALYGEAQSVLYTDRHQGKIDRLNLYTDKIYALTFKLLYNDFSFRMGYSDFKLTLPSKDIDDVLNGLNALGIPMVSQAVNQYQIKDSSVQYIEVGAKYDFGNAYLVAEHMILDSNTFLSNNHAWYVGTGYNFENWSPFVLYSNVDSSQNYKNIKSEEGMPVELVRAINGTNQALSAISESMVQVELKTLSLGTTYNLSENSLLKLQYDRQEEFKKNRLNFHFSDDNKVDLNIFSAAISFVF